MQNVWLRLIEPILSHVGLHPVLIILRWCDHQRVLVDLVLRREEIRLAHVVVGRVLEAEGVGWVGVLPLQLDVVVLKLLGHHHAILRVFVMHMAVLFSNWTDGTRLVLMARWLLGEHHWLVLRTLLHLLGNLLTTSAHVDSILLRLAVVWTVVGLALLRVLWHLTGSWPATTRDWRSWLGLRKITIVALPLVLLLDLRLWVIVHTHATLVGIHVEILVLLPIASTLHHLVVPHRLLLLEAGTAHVAISKVEWCVILGNGTISWLAHTTIRREELLLLLLHHWVVVLALVKLLLRLTIGLVHSSELNICVVWVASLVVFHSGARKLLLLLLLRRLILRVGVELLGVLRMGAHVRNVTCVRVVICWTGRLRWSHRLRWLCELLLMYWLLGHHLVLLCVLHLVDLACVLLLVWGHCHRLWSRVILWRNRIVRYHHLCIGLISSAKLTKLVPGNLRCGHFAARLLLNHPYLQWEARVRLASCAFLASRVKSSGGIVYNERRPRH